MISTADKVSFVDLLSAAGLPVIEVSAFVSPKWVPQMGDAADVFKGISRTRGSATGTRAEPRRPRAGSGRRRHRGCDFCSRLRHLQPQEHQSDDQRRSSATASFVSARRNKHPARRLRFDGVWLPVRGPGPTRARRDGVRRPVDMGAFEVSVSDTIGIAHPGQVALSCLRWPSA